VSAPGAAPPLDLERVICREEDLEAHTARAFTIGGGRWPLRGLVVRSSCGVHAYLNNCPHAGHPLDLIPGRFLTADGTLLLCSSHGALFEKSTGLCVAGPCAGRALAPLALELRAGVVLLAPEVELSGPPELAAP
jgi:nitrite reductase/ring-hydroxylating ferredoxin subunit